jgi:hypothetical protein
MASSGSKKLLCGGELEFEASKFDKALFIAMLISHIPRYSGDGGAISMSLFAYSRPRSSAGEFGGLTCIWGRLS